MCRLSLEDFTLRIVLWEDGIREFNEGNWNFILDFINCTRCVSKSLTGDG